jgi:hypothetical protein
MRQDSFRIRVESEYEAIGMLEVWLHGIPRMQLDDVHLGKADP